MGIIWMIVIGFVAGLVAKLIMPGEERGGFIMTTVLGIAGSFVGGFLLGGSTGLIGWVLGAILILFLARLLRK